MVLVWRFVNFAGRAIEIERAGDRLHSRDMSKYDFDVAVIGGGSGGYAAARTTSASGLRTVVIEGGKELGGLCILRGCMPTKALLYAAEIRHLAKHASTWGITTQGVGFDFAAVMARKDAMVRDFADYRVKQLHSGKFEFIRAHARFEDAHMLELSDGRRITAEKIVIATGSSVSPSPLPQLEAAGYLTSDDALELDKLPKSLIVLGGGAIALEFAQFFVRMDVKVTLIQRSSHVLKGFDDGVSDAIVKVFKREGIAVHLGTELKDAGKCGNGKFVSLIEGGQLIRVEAEEILYAMGRIANTESLRLDKAGVETIAGKIITDAAMRTSAPHIFAAGDCTSEHDLVHLAVAQGEVAGGNIVDSNTQREMDYRLLTEVVFTDPQIAVVGLTRKQAVARGISVIEANYPFNDHGKSLIMEALDGYVSLLAEPGTGEILGGCCVGPLAGELIHEVITAMYKRMTVRELATMPHYHPTLVEIWTYPAEELADQVDAMKR